MGFVFALLSLALAYYVLVVWRSRDSEDDVSALQGPKSSSWLYGSTIDYKHAIPAGEMELAWFRRYGNMFKWNACFGEERVMVCDPTAVRHIFNDTSSFIKSRTYQIINILGFGEGNLISAHGEDHRRIRTVMNSMFSPGRVRKLVPIVEKCAKDLSEELGESSGTTVDAFHLIHKVTLHSITQAVMGYDTTRNGEYTSTYGNLLYAVSQRSPKGVIVDSLVSRVPAFLISIFKRFPPPDLKILLKHYRMTTEISEQLIASRKASLSAGDSSDTDLFSVLFNANEKARDKMTHEELKDQFSGLIAAGEDTTANSLSWIFYVLAEHPEWQQKIREEFNEALAASGSGNVDYDRLPFLNAIIKEVLRVYPAGLYTERETACDTVVPLSKPVYDASGKLVDTVRMKKGRIIVISMSAYNRLYSIWGDDADVLDPYRWLDGRVKSSSGTIGPYANLLNFIGGPRTCLGWRYSVLEMQVIVAEIVKNFTFALPAGHSVQMACGITLVPLDKEGKTGLPLIFEGVRESS